MDEAVSSSQHEQPGLDSDPSSAAAGLPGNINTLVNYLNGAEGAGPAINEDPGFHEHVHSLRDTMFYVCQGNCLCGTVNNRGKVIYCYGDLVPRQGDMLAEGAMAEQGTSSNDLLAAQLGVATFGIVVLLLVLILIRKSIRSMKNHLEKMSNRLPYHYDDDEMSNHSATSPQINAKDTTMDTMKK